MSEPIGAVDGHKLRELLDNLELASRRENQTGIVVAIQVIRNDLKTGRLALALPAPASLDAPYKVSLKKSEFKIGEYRVAINGPGLEKDKSPDSETTESRLQLLETLLNTAFAQGRTQPAPVEEGKDKCLCYTENLIASSGVHWNNCPMSKINGNSEEGKNL